MLDRKNEKNKFRKGNKNAMIKKEKYTVEIEEEKIIEAWCDLCNTKFDDTTTMCNGFGQIGIGFGFGSGFDGSYFNLQICDDCFLKNFGYKLMKQFKEKEMNVDEIKKEIVRLNLPKH